MFVKINTGFILLVDVYRFYVMWILRDSVFIRKIIGWNLHLLILLRKKIIGILVDLIVKAVSILFAFHNILIRLIMILV